MQRGDVNGLRTILNEHPEVVDVKAGELLYAAVDDASLEILACLHEAGCDLNATFVGSTPLVHAVEIDELDVVKWLLDHGADVNARATDRDSRPLEQAIEEGNLAMIGLLLGYGADPNLQSGNPGRNAVAMARFHGHDEAVSFLTSRGCTESNSAEPPPADVESEAFMSASFDNPEQWIEQQWWPVYDNVVRRGIESLGEKNRLLFLVGYLIDQVQNEGADFYFMNPSAEYAAETVDALRTVGASQTAALLEEMVAMFPAGSLSVDLEQNSKLMAELPESFAEKCEQLESLVEAGGGGAEPDLTTRLFQFYYRDR